MQLSEKLRERIMVSRHSSEQVATQPVRVCSLARFFILLFALLLPIGPLAAQAPEAWQTDWEKFLDELSPYLQRGDGTITIGRRFENREVNWEGTFLQISGKFVDIRMNSRTMFCCGSGGTTYRIEFRSTIEVPDLTPWRTMSAGTPVRFKTMWSLITPTSNARTEFLIAGTGLEVLPGVPIIQRIVNGASLGQGVAARSWISILGSNLSATTRIWNEADFTGNLLPSGLDGVRVSINGRDAPVYFISPAQLNVLAPNDDMTGTVRVVVATRAGNAEGTVSLNRYAPAFFPFEAENRRYAAAVFPDGGYVGKPALFGSALTTKPSQPGSRILLFGTGFGRTSPDVPTDQIVSSAVPLAEGVTIKIGGVPATLEFAGLVSSGLYQFNIVIPNLPDGDHAVSAELGGVTSPSGLFLSIANPQAARPVVSPGSFTFRYQQAGPVPTPQSLQISSTAGVLVTSLNGTTDRGGNWLRLNASTVTSPGTATVSIDTAGLAVGSYTGAIRAVSGTVSVNIPVWLTVSAPNPPAYTISTLAGTGASGGAGNGGPSTLAQLNLPFAVAADPFGNVYVAEFFGNRVRKISVAGTITGFAGTGTLGSLGDGGPAASAQLYNPSGLAAGPDGTIYIAEYGHRIRKVTPDGIIQTIAGNGQGGNAGDGGPATLATLNLPTGLALDDFGNLFVSEAGSGRIRKISAAGIISTFVQGLDRVDSVAVDRAGNVYAGDFVGRLFRYDANGRATLIQTAQGLHVAADYNGNVYALLPAQIIRDPEGARTIIAGTGLGGYAGDGGPATAALFSNPRNLAFLPDGSILMPERENNRVRKLTPSAIVPPTFQLTSSLSQFSIPYTIGGPNPGLVSIDIGATNSGTLNISIAAVNAPWLTVTPTSGKTPSKISLGFLTNGLTAGNYEGTLRITSPEASNSPLDIAVRLAVSGSAIGTPGSGPYLVSTAAGSGMFGKAGVPGPALNAQLSLPTFIIVDPAGNYYFSDSFNNRVLKMSAGTNTITLVAGNGVAGFGGDGAIAAAAQLNYPSGLALVGNDLYLADTLNHRIRRVNLVSGIITAFAGAGPTGGPSATFGGGSFGGDNGPAAAALLNSPSSLVSDGSSLYFGDGYNYRIRKISLTGTNTITTVVGSGVRGLSGDGGPPALATMGTIGGMALSPSGELWLADYSNSVIREVNFRTNRIRRVGGTGVAGYFGDGGAPLLAGFDSPVGVAFDSNGGVLVSEFRNHRIRRIHEASNSVTTIAGSGATGIEVGQFAGDGGLATAAKFSQPAGLAVLPSGQVLVVDSFNNRIRMLTPIQRSNIPVIFNGSVSASSLSATSARIDVRFDWVDGDGDITYNGTFTGASTVSITDPSLPNCSDMFISSSMNGRNQQTGTISFFITFTWNFKKTSTSAFPLRLVLRDAAGHESAPLEVFTKEWYLLSSCH